MKDLRFTGNSANIAYYAEHDENGRPLREVSRIFAEILRSDEWTRQRRKNPGKGSWFYVRVYRIGTINEIAKSVYRPRSEVPPGPLDDKTATRLVRQALKGA